MYRMPAVLSIFTFRSADNEAARKQQRDFGPSARTGKLDVLTSCGTDAARVDFRQKNAPRNALNSRLDSRAACIRPARGRLCETIRKEMPAFLPTSSRTNLCHRMKLHRNETFVEAANRIRRFMRSMQQRPAFALASQALSGAGAKLISVVRTRPLCRSLSASEPELHILHCRRSKRIS